MALKIEVKAEKTKLILNLIGRLDTTTAPQLETVVADNLTDVTDLQMDFAGLEYLSSAGLRVILATSKQMKAQGSMVITHVNKDVMEVFTITGFTDILTIESGEKENHES